MLTDCKGNLMEAAARYIEKACLNRSRIDGSCPEIHRKGLFDPSIVCRVNSYPEGSSQGDGPMGTLTSEPFLILGPWIKLLVGGGCDPLVEYVELLVDGYGVARATGTVTG
jgi:hypothetical protein